MVLELLYTIFLSYLNCYILNFSMTSCIEPNNKLDFGRQVEVELDL